MCWAQPSHYPRSADEEVQCETHVSTLFHVLGHSEKICQAAQSWRYQPGGSRCLKPQLTERVSILAHPEPIHGHTVVKL